MDPLGDVLDLTQVRGSVAATLHASDGWGLDLAAVPGAAFHAVTSGTAWLIVPGHQQHHLMPGDVVLLPTGVRHELVSSPGHPRQSFDHVAAEQAMAAGGRLSFGEGVVHTQILCASYQHDPAVMAPLLGLLPPVMYVPSQPAEVVIDNIVRLLAYEIAEPRPGASGVLNRLLDVVLVHVIRAWLATGHKEALPASWLAGLRDPVVGAALAAIHAEPARAWTLEDLARHTATSRATLTRRFPALVGQTPGNYLTNWRMDLAARKLRTTTESVGEIARAVGYTSEYAFNRAFTRTRGTPPGRYRTKSLTGEQAPDT
jgi:AraC-like DNA-binding protein